VAVSLRSSTELSHGELAALFTAAYEGYFVPFVVDEATFEFMVEVFDLDLSESLVADDDDGPVGLANLGRRGRRTWLGGVGVVPEGRRQVIGELLTRELVERARALGADEMVLEVIVENGPAIRLYEKLGFVRTRELEVLSLAASEPAPSTPRKFLPRRPVRSSGHPARERSRGSATTTRSIGSRRESLR
jgi:GNAT superfamily N-acetyltransferase